jgi:hypothetical protein
MSGTSEEKPKLIIDDDWKERVQAEKAAVKEKDKAATEPEEQPQIPPASFATLVHSLTAQTLSALGQLPDAEGKRTLHLDLAKHLIDTLGLIEEKTKGNLTPDESTLLSEVLYELRMLFVHVRSHGTGPVESKPKSPLLDV